MGTTLEILAPYLPYGIEVAHAGWGRGVLSSIHAGRPSAGTEHLGRLVVDYKTEHGHANKLLSPADVLPVLRSFADLCTPLEDGTVPAVEVAKLALSERLEYQHTIDMPTNAASRTGRKKKQTPDGGVCSSVEGG